MHCPGKSVAVVACSFLLFVGGRPFAEDWLVDHYRWGKKTGHQIPASLYVQGHLSSVDYILLSSSTHAISVLQKMRSGTLREETDMPMAKLIIVSCHATVRRYLGEIRKTLATNAPRNDERTKVLEVLAEIESLLGPSPAPEDHGESATPPADSVVRGCCRRIIAACGYYGTKHESLKKSVELLYKD